jgi:hypothetical protein
VAGPLSPQPSWRYSIAMRAEEKVNALIRWLLGVTKLYNKSNSMIPSILPHYTVIGSGQTPLHEHVVPQVVKHHQRTRHNNSNQDLKLRSAVRRDSLHLIRFVHNKMYVTSSTTAQPFNQCYHIFHIGLRYFLSRQWNFRSAKQIQQSP